MPKVPHYTFSSTAPALPTAEEELNAWETSSDGSQFEIQDSCRPSSERQVAAASGVGPLSAGAQPRSASSLRRTSYTQDSFSNKAMSAPPRKDLQPSKHACCSRIPSAACGGPDAAAAAAHVQPSALAARERFKSLHHAPPPPTSLMMYVPGKAVSAGNMPASSGKGAAARASAKDTTSSAKRTGKLQKPRRSGVAAKPRRSSAFDESLSGCKDSLQADSSTAPQQHNPKVADHQPEESRSLQWYQSFEVVSETSVIDFAASPHPGSEATAQHTASAGGLVPSLRLADNMSFPSVPKEEMLTPSVFGSASVRRPNSAAARIQSLATGFDHPAAGEADCGGQNCDSSASHALKAAQAGRQTPECRPSSAFSNLVMNPNTGLSSVPKVSRRATEDLAGQHSRRCTDEGTQAGDKKPTQQGACKLLPANGQTSNASEVRRGSCSRASYCRPQSAVFGAMEETRTHTGARPFTTPTTFNAGIPSASGNFGLCFSTCCRAKNKSML